MGRIYFVTPNYCPGCSIRHHDAYVRTHGKGHPACTPARGREEIPQEGPADAA